MKIKYFRIIFWVGVAIWLTGSAYGGWHKEAHTAIEGYTDQFGIFLMAYGALGDILSGVKVSKDTNITTSNVDVIVKKAVVKDDRS